MRKVLLVLLTVAFVTAISAQEKLTVTYEYKKPKVADVYKPYIGVSSSLAAGTVGYGAEVGIYNSKTWFALTGASNKFNRDYYVGAKAYRKVGQSGIVDSYLFAGANVHYGSDATLGFEPGGALVFNLGEHIAPQIQVSVPFNETDYGKFYPTLGVGLNYFFK